MRKMIVACLLAAALISLAGAQAKTKLTMLMDNQSSKAGLEAVIAAAEAKLGISVEIEVRPGGPEGENVVKTRLAAGEMTDLCFFNSGSLMQALNPAQNFVDLTKEPFMASVLDSFKSAVTAGGKVYGIPISTVMGGGWFYNKKVYAQLGLKVPKTWAELLANCEKIKKAGLTAVIGSYKDDWTSQLILLADFYNVQAQKPNFAADYTAHKAGFANTPIALRGFEKTQEIFAKGYMNKDALATTYDVGQRMLLDGTGVHYPMLTFAVPNMQGIDPKKIMDIGFFAQPGDKAAPNGLTIWMPAAIYLNKNSQNVEAEKKWAAFAISAEGIDAFMSAEKPQGPFAVKGIKLPADILPAIKDMLPYVDAGATAPALEFLSPIKGPNLPQLCVSAGAGLLAPAEAAKQYDKDVEKQAKQLGLAGW
jgi:raffinose/stachyose/melibiose transport system substrate-binding protein